MSNLKEKAKDAGMIGAVIGVALANFLLPLAIIAALVVFFLRACA